MENTKQNENARTVNENFHNELAMSMQRAFPLVHRPFAELARQHSLSEEEVLSIVTGWKEHGGLREISAVMEGAVIGYESALVCGRIERSRLEEVAGIISTHPTVTHNYERNHDYNLWFTIAAPRHIGIEAHLRALEQMSGAGPFYALPRTLTFKVGVVFDFVERRNQTVAVTLPETLPDVRLTGREMRIVRALQSDLPVVREPFMALARAHRLNEDEILTFAREQRGRALRKYVATFRHRRMGISANGMTVWKVAPERLPELGERLAEFSEVSHCYSRATCPNFDYNLYSMLHAGSEDELNRTARRISGDLGVRDYLVLSSPREFKKTRLRFFLAEEDDWWSRHGSGVGQEIRGRLQIAISNSET